MELLEFWQYDFFRYAVYASVLCGISCSLVGVLIVIMRIPFIGVAMSHAAMAGAVLATIAGLNPFWFGLVAALLISLSIGPITDRIRMDTNISLGIIFSLCMGVAFLGIALSPGPNTEMMGLIWGSILLISKTDLIRMLVVTTITLLVLITFYKEFKAVMFSRTLADSSGIRATLIYYLLLIICGTTVTANLDTVGGLMLFSMIINPAAAAYQLSHRMSVMFVLSAVFGILSAGSGLIVSALMNLPSGACVVITSSLLFIACAILSPKRKENAYVQ